jgi:hypothetical protein
VPAERHFATHIGTHPRRTRSPGRTMAPEPQRTLRKFFARSHARLRPRRSHQVSTYERREHHMDGSAKRPTIAVAAAVLARSSSESTEYVGPAT